jgi:hypothetical protein
MRPLTALALLALVPRCGPVPPEERVFPPGRYAYQARHLLPEATDSVTRSGFLVLAEVAPDSLVGQWEVEGYSRKFVEAYHNVVSYYLLNWAESGADSVLVSHYVRGNGDQPTLDCRTSVTRPDYRKEGWCTLERVDP